MPEPSARTASHEDLLGVPSRLVAEILNGRLVTHPRPPPRQAFAASSLRHELIGPFQKGRGGPGGWCISGEPELHMGADVMVPDIAGWRREHLHTLPETAGIETAPDWVCEILSPTTARDDRVVKMALYARDDIDHLWLIDPDLRMLEVYALESGRWLLLESHRDDARITAPPFGAVEIELDALWS
ncbi:MAG: Uma2 family endonuclease [Gammaproteobacteria bacterium]|nr:Uma2 family endonuclease [Gammaproteobacteria bacterium]